MTGMEKADGKSAQGFFNWAYKGRAKMIEKLKNGEEVSHDKLFLSFTTHNPAFVSNGSKGLNASIKGIGWVPKPELMPAVLEDYLKHIATYDPEDKTYSDRGLQVLYKHLYSDEAAKNIDFTLVTSLEMAFVHSWYNYIENPEATLIFYQPPAISYELRGKMEIRGVRHAKEDPVDYKDLDIYQQFINAQHDMYHAPNVARWKCRPAYVFKIEEIYNNGVGPDGFGKKLEFPINH